MYTAFFGLHKDPFSISPDPGYLFLSERHREALAHLLYGAQGAGGIVLLTGDIGTGKTTVCRKFLLEAPSTSHVAYIFNPRLSVIELLKSISDEFGIPVARTESQEASIKTLVDALNRFLLQAHAAGRNPTLIIDEAQNLSPEVLEQLRLLTNLETNERKLLQIVLIGQPELRSMLALPGLEQLSQRIVARCHLGPLDAADTHRYVKHRLSVAGFKGPMPFDQRAVRRVHHLSGGVPRKINLLCGRSMLGAYAAGQKTIGAQVVDRAAKEVFGETATVPRSGSGWGLLATGILAGALLVLGGLWAYRYGSNAVAIPPAAVAPAAAPTPEKPAVAAPPPAAITPAAQVAAASAYRDEPPARGDLLGSENEGWRAIAPGWGFDAAGNDPCGAAQLQGLQCYRTPRMTLNGARQMDRPAVLRLKMASGSGWAVLEGFDQDKVVLSAGPKRWALGATELQSIWRGEYLSIWRLPPNLNRRVNNGMDPSTAPWLDEKLTELQSAGQLDSKARTLAQRVAAFQRSKGLEVDGRATPTTLILINRASGVDEPRLLVVTP